MDALNNSKLDKQRNSVECGTCSLLWGLEDWIDEYPFVCKRCGSYMVKQILEPMPIRELSKIITNLKPL